MSGRKDWILVGAALLTLTANGWAAGEKKEAKPAKLSAVLKEPAKFSKEKLELEGWIVPGPPVCTLAFCPPKKCCNRCSASLMLADKMPEPAPQEAASAESKAPDGGQKMKPFLPLTPPAGASEEKNLFLAAKGGPELSCSGDNCTWRNRCSIVPGKYRLYGRVKLTKDRSFFIVEKALPIEEKPAGAGPQVKKKKTGTKQVPEQVEVTFGDPKAGEKKAPTPPKKH